ncbi:MAG: TetR family transcriptional regulator [Pseudonocardiales bacterium]|nr:MAG: TetR family transcriptional regulator [Pseudonocardiales bacterium]
MPESELSSGLSQREGELLNATLEVLHETGYDRLTVDEVVARAHASKATVYRRWPSKIDLVVAAFAHGVRQVAQVPDTGSLRGDLLHLGGLIIEQLGLNGNAIGGLLPEIRRSPKLRAVFEREFFVERRALMHSLLARAVERSEISATVISDELWDVLPGYLVFRTLVPGRPPSLETVRALVDDVILPSLSRPTEDRPRQP